MVFVTIDKSQQSGPGVLGFAGGHEQFGLAEQGIASGQAARMVFDHFFVFFNRVALCRL